MKIPLNKIIILPDRQRKDLGSVEDDLPSMADPEVGLIMPVLVEPQVDGTFVLVAGERRTRKARFLGWTDIEATTRSGLTDLIKQKMEFVENVERKDLVWQERCLAVFRMYKLENRIRKSKGEDAFTIRAMASFSGYTKSSIGYMIQIGDCLSRIPKDEEMWSTENYTKGIALLLERTEKVLNPEREKHQALANATQFNLAGTTTHHMQSGDGLNIQSLNADGPLFIPSQGAVQLLDPTPEQTVVYIHARKMRYEDDKENKAHTSACILAYGSSEITDHIDADLRPEGFAVLWSKQWNMDDFQYMPLIWNEINIPKTPEPFRAPFFPNYTLGVVSGPLDRIFDNPQGSVISCMPDDDPSVLPAAVVEYSIRQLASENMAVVLPCGVNPVHVAEIGRVPIFYEENNEKYLKKVAELIAHYESVIPGVKCVVKS